MILRLRRTAVIANSNAPNRAIALRGRVVEVQNLFAEFVVVLAEGDQGSPWKAISGAGYIPQVLLFGANGVQLDATSGNAKYPYFFGSAQQLTVGMRSALKMAAGTPSAKGEL